MKAAAQVLLLAWQIAAPAADTSLGCTASEIVALAASAKLVARGDDAAARKAVDKQEGDPDDRCVLTRLSRWSLVGWVEARKLAAVGGPPELQGAANQALQALERLKGNGIEIDAEYAQTAIRAAIAAAQDERAELELLLTHARDLSERLVARGRRATWPRTFNVLAGELWFEVDRYEEARAAFERAAKADGGAIAQIGLARTLGRLGQQDEACALYRGVGDAAAALREAAQQDLARCQ